MRRRTNKILIGIRDEFPDLFIEVLPPHLIQPWRWQCVRQVSRAGLPALMVLLQEGDRLLLGITVKFHCSMAR